MSVMILLNDEEEFLGVFPEETVVLFTAKFVNKGGTYSRCQFLVNEESWYIGSFSDNIVDSELREVEFQMTHIFCVDEWSALPDGLHTLTVTLSVGFKSYEEEETDSKTYTFIKGNNVAPTSPVTIWTPSNIYGGTTITVGWSSATDEDGNLEGYILERSLNGSSTWEQIYKGSLTSSTDTVPYGTSTVQYGVKAYDSDNATSTRRVTSIANVINNTPPKISGSDENLGQCVTAFTKTYSVTDDEGGVVSVSEKVDGVELKKFNVTLGATNTVSFSQADWAKVGNGSHTLTIMATDSDGETDTRTFTFTKLETEIHLQYKTPYETTSPVVLGILTVKKEIASGATFSVEACNNGFDTSPTWENITSSVNLGGRFYLNNATKTASKWGYNVRIKVDRGSAVGDCTISGVSGYFRES